MNNLSNIIVEQIKNETPKWKLLKEEVKKGIVGQENIIEKILIGLLCNGHILIEGVPGLAKTTLIKTIAQAIGINFKRIQFTPDLLPSDLLGTLIYNPKTQDFETKKGPIFANIILSDEINRAPAKIQSALLEAMQEHQVTIGETTHFLEDPFLVLATQNPIEQEGTYHLPEAQVDRFMFKLIINYPKIEDEELILKKIFHKEVISPILNKSDLQKSRDMVEQIYIDEKIIKYILNIIFATREPQNYGLKSIKNLIEYGASPRASITLHHASRANAFLKNRHFVIPEDIKSLASDILRHRILLTYEAEAQNICVDDIINKILETIPVP